MHRSRWSPAFALSQSSAGSFTCMSLTPCHTDAVACIVAPDLDNCLQITCAGGNLSGSVLLLLNLPCTRWHQSARTDILHMLRPTVKLLHRHCTVHARCLGPGFLPDGDGGASCVSRRRLPADLAVHSFAWLFSTVIAHEAAADVSGRLISDRPAEDHTNEWTALPPALIRTFTTLQAGRLWPDIPSRATALCRE